MLSVRRRHIRLRPECMASPRACAWSEFEGRPNKLIPVFFFPLVEISNAFWNVVGKFSQHTDSNLRHHRNSIGSKNRIVKQFRGEWPDAVAAASGEDDVRYRQIENKNNAFFEYSIPINCRGGGLQ